MANYTIVEGEIQKNFHLKQVRLDNNNLVYKRYLIILPIYDGK